MTLEQLKHRINSLPEHTQDEIIKAYSEMQEVADQYIDKRHTLATENIELIDENARLKSKVKELERVIGGGWRSQLNGDKPYSLRLNGEYYGTGDFAYMIELMHEWVVIRGMYGKGEVEFEIVDETKRKPTLTEKVIAHRLGKKDSK